MAINSAVVMPLKRCCLTKISKTPPLVDKEDTLMYCFECSTFLKFTNQAWKLIS